MIIRWTLGNVSALGEQTLRWSVRAFSKFASPEIELAVCYNNRKPPKGLPEHVRLIDQNEFLCDWKHAKPTKKTWRMVPFRLDVNQHEVFIDNDLILFRPPEALIKFAKSKQSFLRANIGPARYGKFSGLNPADPPHISASLFGFPPKYDPADEIDRILSERPVEVWDSNDMHGLITALLNDKKSFQVNESEIATVRRVIKTSTCGVHFQGINKRKFFHPWNEFQRMTIPI